MELNSCENQILCSNFVPKQGIEFQFLKEFNSWGFQTACNEIPPVDDAAVGRQWRDGSSRGAASSCSREEGSWFGAALTGCCCAKGKEPLDNVGMTEKMSIATPLTKLIRCVILGLDGTLLNTDGIVGNVLKVLLSKYGKQWDGRESHKIVGKTPFEAAAAVVEGYGLPCSTNEFVSQISPLFSDHKLSCPVNIIIYKRGCPAALLIRGGSHKIHAPITLFTLGNLQTSMKSIDWEIRLEVIGGATLKHFLVPIG